MPTLPSPDLVADRYKLIRKLGAGNMSTVYEGEDTRRANRIVAVKLLDSPHPDELRRELFRRETIALDKLEHPNIVCTFDQGWTEDHNCHYIVLEYIARTLEDEIRAHRDRKDPEWCWHLMRQMADALVHAHSHGVIHRDLKPSNILITDEGTPKGHAGRAHGATDATGSSPRLSRAILLRIWTSRLQWHNEGIRWCSCLAP